MTAFAYYNEIEPFAAEWLRNLITAGHIAPGVVDTRSIEDVCPSDLAEFRQCHFFAGVGVWSYALRRAGWPDTDRVWTGSCPCQPFSTAGKGGGFSDERHLWPHFHYLIEECRPSIVLGEQVASADGLAWLDLVQADLEATDYASAAADLCAAGVGAPHIRQRLYWVAHAAGARLEGRGLGGGARSGQQGPAIERGGEVGGLADLHRDGCEQRGQGFAPLGHGQAVESDCGVGGLGHADSERARGFGRGLRVEVHRVDGQHSADHAGASGADAFLRPAGPTNGLWSDADWLLCRDGKWRPVEPGTFPLAHGAASRVGRLRAYGNAINAAQAEIFIRAVMECMP